MLILGIARSGCIGSLIRSNCAIIVLNLFKDTVYLKNKLNKVKGLNVLTKNNHHVAGARQQAL